MTRPSEGGAGAGRWCTGRAAQRFSGSCVFWSRSRMDAKGSRFQDTPLHHHHANGVSMGFLEASARISLMTTLLLSAPKAVHSCRQWCQLVTWRRWWFAGGSHHPDVSGFFTGLFSCDSIVATQNKNLNQGKVIFILFMKALYINKWGGIQLDRNLDLSGKGNCLNWENASRRLSCGKSVGNCLD